MHVAVRAVEITYTHVYAFCSDRMAKRIKAILETVSNLSYKLTLQKNYNDWMETYLLRAAMRELVK